MRRNLVPWLFLTPYLAIFMIFWMWPIIMSVAMSFMNTRVDPWAFSPGMNWPRILNDPAFRKALWNTLTIMAVQVPLMLVFSTGLAIALNSKLLRFKGLFRFAFFAPVVVGEVAYSAIFRLMFNTDFGSVNDALEGIGLARLDWLNDPTLSFWVIVIAITWRWAGYNAIILLAGLQSIDDEIYEAARLDGASRARMIFRITVPLLRPVLLFALVLSIIGTMQLFTEPALITKGGPGGATTTLGYYLYQQGFKSFNFGYASVIAWVIFLIAVFFSGLKLRLFGKAA